MRRIVSASVMRLYKNKRKQLQAKIKTMFNVEHVEIDDLSCAFITQGGPQCLAIQVISK